MSPDSQRSPLSDGGTSLLFAPVPGDAVALRALLAELGVDAVACGDAREFYRRLGEDVLLAIVTEEGLTACRLEELSGVLGRQPAWSDLPLLALAGGDTARLDDGRFDTLSRVGNFTLIQRPTSRQVLVMAMCSAIRTRRLQYAVRDHWRELESHAVRLQAAVDERTRELEREVAERNRVEAELKEAHRLESLGRLTGGVAHDFNNLLQVISGGENLIRLVYGKQIDIRVGRALESIHRAAERGASLTQRLLAYARRQPLANVKLDLSAHLSATMDLLLRSIEARIALRLSLAGGLWPVEADPAQLDAAILNIVGNARDAMPGGGELTMAARNVVLPDPGVPEARALVGDYVCLTITDSGDGMSPTVAERAFEPFYTTKAIGIGTGLGLSQVYGFAMQSHGLAFIRREPRGTTIGMLLPRTHAATPAPDPARTSEDVDVLDGIDVLCVEDDPAVAETTLALLDGLGANVTLADGADAAMRMEPDRFDLVLSDVMMPGSMDGVGLARWLAAHHPGVPVVLCSGYVLEPHRLEALHVEFLRKPYTLSELLSTIRRALARAG